MMTSSRLIVGYLVAVGVGLVVSRMSAARVLKPALVASLEKDAKVASKAARRELLGLSGAGGAVQGDGFCGRDEPKHGCCDHGHDHHGTVAEADSRVVAAFRSALKDFVDVAVYFTVGVAITALFNTGIAPGAKWLDQVASQPVGAPAALMLLAYVLSLCSTSDAFIAATLDRFTYGAKLAFLVFGPMMDVKLTFLYQTVMRRRFIAGMALGIFLAIGTIAVLWQHFLLQIR